MAKDKKKDKSDKAGKKARKSDKVKQIEIARGSALCLDYMGKHKAEDYMYLGKC